MNYLERLERALRQRVILRTERGERLVGYKCDLCGMRWRGRKEKHSDDCVFNHGLSLNDLDELLESFP